MKKTIQEYKNDLYEMRTDIIESICNIIRERELVNRKISIMTCISADSPDVSVEINWAKFDTSEGTMIFHKSRTYCGDDVFYTFDDVLNNESLLELYADIELATRTMKPRKKKVA